MKFSDLCAKVAASTGITYTPPVRKGGYLVAVFHLGFDDVEISRQHYRSVSGILDALQLAIIQHKAKQGRVVSSVDTNGENITGIVCRFDSEQVEPYNPLDDLKNVSGYDSEEQKREIEDKRIKKEFDYRFRADRVDCINYDPKDELIQVVTGRYHNTFYVHETDDDNSGYIDPAAVIRVINEHYPHIKIETVIHKETEAYSDTRQQDTQPHSCVSAAPFGTGGTLSSQGGGTDGDTGTYFPGFLEQQTTE